MSSATTPLGTGGRYCVIGAGAAGLAAVKSLREQGADVVGFEATDRVGGHWHTDYEALHLITPRGSSGFPDRPMPGDYPLFPHRDQVRDYLVGYAEHHRLTESIVLSTPVTAVEPLDGNGRTGWRVHTSRGDEGVFDGVIVANGHLWDPSVPPVAGDFTGHSVHSSGYLNTGDIKGDRVLVVGSGNSGCDIAVDAAQARFTTAICVRDGQMFQPKTLLGRPRAEIPWLVRLPAALQERVARALIGVSLGAPEDYPGLPAPADRHLDRNPPVVNNQLLYWLHHGRITAVPAIERISGREVAFADGTRREFDTVIWATGFDISFPFLAEELLTRSGRVPLRTAGGTLPVGLERLYFVGLAAPRGPQFPVYSAQMELVTRFIGLHERAPGPGLRLSEAAQRVLPQDDRVDLIRRHWLADMDRAHAFAARLERAARRH
ncbi:flavin-containing monooxygenase [Nocardiopsis sediminis]|uniref:Flavin-containing monooxygenase n=1 Tax=Nocardiopsis sediminis TaxID=1778267 RepID=A0ABV8FQD8_9ACTN